MTARAGRHVLPRAFRASAVLRSAAKTAFEIRRREYSRLACPTPPPRGMTLIIENHYKDNYWQYPEFAQRMDVFCDLVDRDRLAALRRELRSEQYLPGRRRSAGIARAGQASRCDDARQRPLSGRRDDRGSAAQEEDSVGYAKRLRHGEIGQGLNDYDAIFHELAGVGFDGWISIEDGVDGMEQLHRSVKFLRMKIAEHWPGK